MSSSYVDIQEMVTLRAICPSGGTKKLQPFDRQCHVQAWLFTSERVVQPKQLHAEWLRVRAGYVRRHIADALASR